MSHSSRQSFVYVTIIFSYWILSHFIFHLLRGYRASFSLTKIWRLCYINSLFSSQISHFSNQTKRLIYWLKSLSWFHSFFKILQFTRIWMFVRVKAFHAPGKKIFLMFFINHLGPHRSSWRWSWNSNAFRVNQTECAICLYVSFLHPGHQYQRFYPPINSLCSGRFLCECYRLTPLWREP